MTPNRDDLIPCRLTASPVALRDAGFVPPDYLSIRASAVNGLIPAHQRNGIWHFYREDIAEIASALRLTRRVSIAA